MLLYYQDEALGWQFIDGPLDRGLQFGDGLFETVRLDARGQSPLKDGHIQRLGLGMRRLGFSAQACDSVLKLFSELLSGQVPAVLNTGDSDCPVSAGALKLIVTRGVSERGYASTDDLAPALYVQYFEVTPLNNAVAEICVGINPVRLGIQPLLAGLKHLNRLEQVLARRAFQPEWDESLMLDVHSRIIEGCMSNVYLKLDDHWLTPTLTESGVAGVVRDWLLASGQVVESTVTLQDLERCSALAFSNSLTGFRSVIKLDGNPLASDPQVNAWQESYCSLFN